MKNDSTAEEFFASHLTHPSVDKDALKKLSAHIATIQAANLKVERIWWIGIPIPESLYVRTRIPIAKIIDLSHLVNQHIPYVIVHPIGVPVLEAIDATVNIPLNRSIPGNAGFINQ